VIADIQKLTADAQAGSTDKSSLKSTIQADIKKLTADLQSGHQTMQTDRAQAQSDLQAAKAAGVKLGALKTQLQQLKQLGTGPGRLPAGSRGAKQAIAALKQSFHK
jgi:hypothetical protein